MVKAVILCVDDEIGVLNSLKIQLKNEFSDTYLYEAAESADEALELIEELQQEQIDIVVVVSDWLMPGIKGDEFLIRVHQKFPKIVKIMLTGQADQQAIKRALEEANLHGCLHKPWESKELIKTIRTGIEKLAG
ncbi:MAG: response regulator [Okeania sp. SIO2H7]|nr:response regulator [Okeania sp. SIO2H7]